MDPAKVKVNIQQDIVRHSINCKKAINIYNIDCKTSAHQDLGIEDITHSYRRSLAMDT